MLSGSVLQNKALCDASARSEHVCSTLCLARTALLPCYRATSTARMRPARCGPSLGVSGVTGLEHKSKRSHLTSS